MPAVQRSWVPALEAAAGTGLGVLLISAAGSLHWLASYPSVVAILILLVGYGYYATRHLLPIVYGTAEILIGMMIIVAAMQGAPAGVPNEPDFWGLVGKFAGGIFLIGKGFEDWARSRFVAAHDQVRWILECRWGGSGTRRS
jgi:hypothetical protein